MSTFFWKLVDSIPLENLSQERILEKSHISHENFQCSNAGSASPNTNLKVECVEEMDIECQTAEEASKVCANFLAWN